MGEITAGMQVGSDQIFTWPISAAIATARQSDYTLAKTDSYAGGAYRHIFCVMNSGGVALTVKVQHLVMSLSTLGNVYATVGCFGVAAGKTEAKVMDGWLPGYGGRVEITNDAIPIGSFSAHARIYSV